MAGTVSDSKVFWEMTQLYHDLFHLRYAVENAESVFRGLAFYKQYINILRVITTSYQNGHRIFEIRVHCVYTYFKKVVIGDRSLQDPKIAGVTRVSASCSCQEYEG